ncbi:MULTISPECIES: hypothetical protein [Cyanophyceae]|uniref:hypothetical protein n=1 Tax=Cyanophyceae TaxID=3028117 RepID=UPI00232FFF09|nr:MULTISPECIES: hypothetical protein [Cyanophyceae]MDB9304125.1 hypothetical protein [Nodularia spumigena CS-591/12]MDB9333683.1 hypothetical protein [Nodularia spumigena CS-590/01]MDB9356133.1 hypothetical protein [Nodularia spumigena CS-587/03]MDB9368234.1 hypothetical protein [Nodularia spumigena CS-586/05]MDB9329837.1 hypothetical protein [Nodularia spumigena CS-591/04]
MKESALKRLKQIGNLFQNKNQTCGVYLLRIESIKPENDVYFFKAQTFKTLAAYLIQRFLSPRQVHVGQGLPEILLGRQWLKNRRLVVDMPLGLLTLG